MKRYRPIGDDVCATEIDTAMTVRGVSGGPGDFLVIQEGEGTAHLWPRATFLANFREVGGIRPAAAATPRDAAKKHKRNAGGRRRGVKLTDPDRAEIQQAYESGERSLQASAEQYGVPVSRLYALRAKHGWKTPAKTTRRPSAVRSAPTGTYRCKSCTKPTDEDPCEHCGTAMGEVA